MKKVFGLILLLFGVVFINNNVNFDIVGNDADSSMVSDYETDVNQPEVVYTPGNPDVDVGQSYYGYYNIEEYASFGFMQPENPTYRKHEISYSFDRPGYETYQDLPIEVGWYDLFSVI